MSRAKITKIYNDDMSARQRTIRFILDNKDTFIDYPVNNVFMIDREDLMIYDHLNGAFERKWTAIGTVSSIVLTLAYVIKSRMEVRVLAAPLLFFPIPLSYLFCYYKLGEFLDYFQVKYKDRGLYDEDLWNYHKENSKELSSS
jgi:hypothetical protein